MGLVFKINPHGLCVFDAVIYFFSFSNLTIF